MFLTTRHISIVLYQRTCKSVLSHTHTFMQVPGIVLGLFCIVVKCFYCSQKNACKKHCNHIKYCQWNLSSMVASLGFVCFWGAFGLFVVFYFSLPVLGIETRILPLNYIPLLLTSFPQSCIAATGLQFLNMYVMHPLPHGLYLCSNSTLR